MPKRIVSVVHPPKPGTPSYRLHRPSGRAVVTLRDYSTGQRRDYPLGTYGSADSRIEYKRLITEWERKGRQITLPPTPIENLSVNELMVWYLDKLEKDNTKETTIREFVWAFRELKPLYGLIPAAQFSPKKLKDVRDAMVRADLCRNLVNRRIVRICRMFEDAVADELIPVEVAQALKMVKPIPRGRGLARETKRITPVPEAFVDAIRPHVSGTIWAMVEIMRYSGMRPGECCVMRAVDIDVAGPIWLFRPHTHKTAHLDRERVVALGPRCQDVLRPFLTLDTQAYLFSPRRVMLERLGRLQAEPNKKGAAVAIRLSVAKRKRPWGDKYGPRSLAKAIARGCELAGIPRWGANRLRHLFATEARREFGVEGAGAMLGHSKLSVTQIYAERDVRLATTVAAKIG